METQQHGSIEFHRQNLANIVRHRSVQAHYQKILLTTPLPVKYQMEDHASLQRRAEDMKLYTEACKALGIKLQSPVVDLWTALLRCGDWKKG